MSWLEKAISQYKNKPAPNNDSPQQIWQRTRQDGHTDEDFVHVWIIWHPDNGIYGVYTAGALAEEIEDKLPIVGVPYRMEKQRLQGWLLRQET